MKAHTVKNKDEKLPKISSVSKSSKRPWASAHRSQIRSSKPKEI